MSDSPEAPRTPIAPTTLSQPHSFRPSTIAASAKRATAQRSKLAKRSKKQKQKQKQKQTKTATSSLLEPEYIESSASEEELEEENESSKGEITLDGRVFRKATDFALWKKRTKTSHVQDKDKGFEIVDFKTGSRHYYCVECYDKRKDKNYVPFIVKGTSNITHYWKQKHGIDSKGKPIQTLS